MIKTDNQCYVPLKAYIFRALYNHKNLLENIIFSINEFCWPGIYCWPRLIGYQIPSLAESLCLPCPPGAECPGGADVVPLGGFWAVSRTGENVIQRRAEIAVGVEVRRRRHNAIFSYMQTKFSHHIWNLQVVRCPPEACLGNGTCSEGRTGPVCGLCM